MELEQDRKLFQRINFSIKLREDVMRTDREKDHEKCIYYKRFKVCVYCKRFYTNKTDLDDLYKEKES